MGQEGIGKVQPTAGGQETTQEADTAYSGRRPPLPPPFSAMPAEETVTQGSDC